MRDLLWQPYKIAWRVNIGGSSEHEARVVRGSWRARRVLWRVFNNILAEGIQLHRVERRKTYVDVGYGTSAQSSRRGWNYDTERGKP